MRALQLVHPSVQERLKTVSALIERRQELRDPLEMHKEILQFQQELDSSPTKGTTTNWDNHAIVDGLWRRAQETKKPIIHFLDPTIFNVKLLSAVSRKIANVFVEHKIDEQGMKNFTESVEKGQTDLLKLVEATLKEDLTPIKKTAEQLGLDPSRLLHALSALIQPCLEEIARQIDSSQLDRWWQASCPVCGRTPIVARFRQRKRYLDCSFCGAEYLSDSVLCVHCGNRDPYTLKYMVVEDQPMFQVDFCTKCKHYLKVIDEAKLKEDMPRGFEDMLTLDFDLVVKKANLER